MPLGDSHPASREHHLNCPLRMHWTMSTQSDHNKRMNLMWSMKDRNQCKCTDLRVGELLTQAFGELHEDQKRFFDPYNQIDKRHLDMIDSIGISEWAHKRIYAAPSDSPENKYDESDDQFFRRLRVARGLDEPKPVERGFLDGILDRIKKADLLRKEKTNTGRKPLKKQITVPLLITNVKPNTAIDIVDANNSRSLGGGFPEADGTFLATVPQHTNVSVQFTKEDHHTIRLTVYTGEHGQQVVATQTRELPLAQAVPFATIVIIGVTKGTKIGVFEEENGRDHLLFRGEMDSVHGIEVTVTRHRLIKITARKSGYKSLRCDVVVGLEDRKIIRLEQVLDV